MRDIPVPHVMASAMTGYNAWVKDLLKPEVASKLFPGFAEGLALIAERRERMRQLDIAGPMGKTAGWSPDRNFKLDGEFPYCAALLLKAAFGPDALTNKQKRHYILQLHPEFSYRSLRR